MRRCMRWFLLLVVAFLASFPSSTRAIVHEANGWRIEKTVQSVSGSTISYYITLERTGPDAGVVTIMDDRDSATTTEYSGYIFPTPVSGGGYSRYMVWTQDMPQGSSFNSGYSVQMQPDLPPGTRIRNKATVIDVAGRTSVDVDVWVDRPNDTTKAHDSAGVSGDPISTATGEYILEPATDFDLGGPLPLRFTRAYASRLNDPGTDFVRSALGPGWTHNFDVRLVRQNPGGSDWSLFVVMNGGKIIPFTALDDGTWALNLTEPFTTYSLQSDGEDLWFCDPAQELLYRFDLADGAGVKEIADRNGNALQIGRRADGLATNVADGLGRELRFEYNAASNLVRVTDGTRTVAYGYDANGSLVAATNALGQAMAYAYDPVNSFTNGNGALMTSVQYPLGNMPLVQSYNTNGQVVAQTDADGFATTFDYGTNRVTAITQPDGSVLRHEYNANGALTKAYDARSNYFQYGFAGGQDNLSWLRDRNGNQSTVTREYESRLPYLVVNRNSYGTRFGHAIRTQTFTNREAPAQTVAFDFPNVLTVTNSNSSTQWFHRDGRGNMTNYVDHAGMTWATTFNSRGQPLTVVNPHGGTQTFAYNADGTLASAADCDVGATTFAYDGLRRRIGVHYPDGSSAGWGLDALDRATAFTNAGGGVTRLEYDANGLPLRTTDPLGHEIARQADLMDRTTNQTDSAGMQTVSAYDNMGRRIRSTDPAGTNLYLYDSRGWVTNLVRAGRTWAWGYDFEGNVINAYSPSGNRTYIRRRPNGDLWWIADPLGNTNDFTYNSMRQVTRHRNPLNKDTYFYYDAAGRLTAITNPVYDGATFEYDADGNQTRQTDFDGNATTFGYTPMGRLAAVTNALGEATRFAYDSSGRPQRTDYADGAHATLTYDAAGRVQTLVDEGTNAWRFAYDLRSAVVAVTNPAAGATAYAYNLDGTLQSASDSDTGVVSNRYDAARRLVETVLPGGASIHYGYNAHDELVGRTDALGRRTEYGYDVDGWLVLITDPDANTSTFGRNAAGWITNATDRTGRTTVYEYNKDGTLKAVTDSTGVRTESWRDNLGRVILLRTGTPFGYTQIGYNHSGAITNVATPSGRSLVRTPDAVHRVARTVNAMGETNSLARDARGRIVAATDPAGRITQYSYDPRGLIGGVTLPDSNVVAYTWNSLGQLGQLADFNGAAWNFAYTPMGRLQSIADPLARATSYAYDTRGQIDAVTWHDSSSVDFTHDANGALVRAQYSTGPDLQFQRDVNGLITNANDVALSRDAEGRILSADDSGMAFGATYDAAGRIATATYANGAFAVTYTYAIGTTGDGKLTSVSNDLTGTQIDLGYDTDRRLRTLTLPNGEVITYTWDDADRLTRLQSGDYVDLALTYDLSGRVTDTDLIAPLTPSGNVTTAIASLAYDAASQISSAGYSHDPRGRMTATPERALTWDGASRLIGEGSVTLHYSGLGDLQTRTEGANTNGFFYNHAIGGAPIVAESDETTGQMLRYYVWTPSGRLLYMIDCADDNKVYFYHFDQVGSTLALTDTNAVLTDAYSYDPYGRVLARTGTNPQPFTFVGAWGVRQEDADGTLYQMRARYYDATLGRFLSPEPIWPQVMEPKALNPYQYAGADPIRFIDPNGLFLGLPGSHQYTDAELDAYVEGGYVGLVAHILNNSASAVKGLDFDLVAMGLALGGVTEKNIQAQLLARFDRRKAAFQAANHQPPPCHAQPKNTAPINPPDLGQRYTENLGKSPAMGTQLTPYQPGGDAFKRVFPGGCPPAAFTNAPPGMVWQNDPYRDPAPPPPVVLPPPVDVAPPAAPFSSEGFVQNAPAVPQSTWDMSVRRPAEPMNIMQCTSIAPNEVTMNWNAQPEYDDWTAPRYDVQSDSPWAPPAGAQPDAAAIRLWDEELNRHFLRRPPLRQPAAPIIDAALPPRRAFGHKLRDEGPSNYESPNTVDFQGRLHPSNPRPPLSSGRHFR